MVAIKWTVLGTASLVAMNGGVGHGQGIPAGSRVRVWSSAEGYWGIETWATRQRGDTLFFRNRPSDAELGIPRAALSRFDVQVHGGPRLGRTVTGALSGLLCGAAVGLAAGELTAGHNPGSEFAGPAGLVVGAFVGSVVGGVIGYGTSHHWQPVPDPHQLEIGPP